MCLVDSVHLAQVIGNQAGIGGVHAVSMPEKFSTLAAIVMGWIQYQVWTSLMRISYQFCNFFPGFGKINIVDVQLLSKLRKIS